MKTGKSIILAAVAVPGLVLSLNAIGKSEGQLPPAHEQGTVTYISGGVGDDQAKAMNHVAKYYPLELEFLHKAKPKDEYLADVKVRIKDMHQKMVLNVTSEGPFLLAKLPEGKYTISAEQNGKIETRDVQIAAGKHRRLVFEWH
jgi:hypothetical protein